MLCQQFLHGVRIHSLQQCAKHFRHFLDVFSCASHILVLLGYSLHSFHGLWNGSESFLSFLHLCYSCYAFLLKAGQLLSVLFD